MTTATVSAFESTLHKTNVWMKDLLEELNWQHSDHQRAYHAMRAVLHALRDRLTVEEASDLASQLPMLVRGFYYEGWNPAKTPTPVHSKEGFLAEVAAHCPGEPDTDVELMARAVFKVMQRHITPGEIDDVQKSLPEAIRVLWN